jgi:NADPH2:quinone reductase
MPHAIRIHQAGGPEVLQWDTVEVGKPGKGQVRLRQTTCGLNYIDIYMRDGTYPIAEYPAVLGMEASGVVEELGEGLAEMNLDLKVGDRVAYAMVAGAYAEERLIDAQKLIKIPDSIDDKTAATMMLKGLTAHYLLFRTYPVKAGDTILVHAASGGVGLMLCQWAKHIGATVIGTVGSAEKAELAMANGCDHTIFYREENIAERVRELTNGKGVAAVYDGIGQSTFEASLDSLQPFGVMVTYGNITGQVEPFSPKILAPKGSLYVTRPTLGTHTATRELLVEGADRLIDVISKGIVKNYVNQSYALKDTAQAHRDMEARNTTGSTVLVC